jgi:hypothetical protein
MSIKSSLIKATAQVICVREDKLASNAVKNQSIVLNQLIIKGRKTSFGKDHKFSKIKDLRSFQQQVPLSDYEKHIHYFERIKQGNRMFFGPGSPNIWLKHPEQRVALNIFL